MAPLTEPEPNRHAGRLLSSPMHLYDRQQTQRTRPLGALTAVDLFCGSGGLTRGLKDAGFGVLGAVEVDDLAVETYRDNHPEVFVWKADIRDIGGEEILDRLGLGVGELDLLAGCPPCQGFSTMTTLNGGRSVADPRNDLVLEYGRLVQELRPRAILMENVPRLAQDERMERLIRLLEECGYPAGEGHRVLNAVDYGVPQRRKRLVLMAGRAGAIPHGPVVPQRMTVRQAISFLPLPGRSGDPLHDLPERRSERVRYLIRAIPRDGGSRADLGEDRQLACHTGFDGFKDVYGRMWWDRPAPTITGGCFNPSKGRFLHPHQDRNITLREAALLQSFPVDYRFSLSRGKQGAAGLIGNAFPPRFGQAHARAIAAALLEADPAH